MPARYLHLKGVGLREQLFAYHVIRVALKVLPETIRMIRLECSNCNKVLTIDDAFAGGVCRCQYCGTIQTVPKPGQPAAGTASDDSPKALFKRKARIESALSPYNDQLDQAADDIDSSGINADALDGLNAPPRRASGSSDSHIPSPSAARRATAIASAASEPDSAQAVLSPQVDSDIRPAATSRPSFSARPSGSASSAPQAKSKAPMLIGIAAAVVALGGTGIWLATRPAPLSIPAPQSHGPATPTANPETAAAKQVAGSICNIPIQGSTVVYILDRSGCTEAAFQKMLAACYRSVESLSASRSFKVIVWNNAQPLAYPAAGTTVANSQNIDDAKKALTETSVGASDVAPVLAEALASNPDEIILISPQDIDAQTAGLIAKAIQGRTVALHGIAVGAGLTGTQLRDLAVATRGGQFQQIDISSIN
jgi:von Willebrand factor type A domain